MKPKFICISGHARNGKDTAAGIMAQCMRETDTSCEIMHYADLLKYICKTYYDWDGAKDENGRTLLQTVGTDYIRAKNPDFWVDFIVDMVEYLPNDWKYIIIPDTRFPNEINRIKERGYDVMHLRVQRDHVEEGKLTNEQFTHSSETSLDNVASDITVNNNGSLEDLEKIIRKVLFMSDFFDIKE